MTQVTSAFPGRAITPARYLAVAAVVLLLLAATLAPYHPGPRPAVPWQCVACSADGGADFVANVAAFAPLGIVLARAGWRPTRATGAGALLSLVVELLQATGIAGRTAVLGDVLANALGTALGALVVAHADALRHPSPVRARQLAAVASVAWVALMTASTWLLGRDVSVGSGRPHVVTAATVPELGWYHGRVTAFGLDGWAAGTGAPGPLVVRAPLGPVVRAAVTLAGGDARGGFVPAVAVVDQDGLPTLLVGQRDDALELRLRTRASRWRLREPSIVLPSALSPLRAGDPTTGAEVVIVVRGHTVDVRSRAWGPGTHVTALATVTRGPADGWALVVPVARPWGPEAPVLDALWVAAPLVPVAWWLALGLGGGRQTAPRLPPPPAPASLQG